MTERADGYVQDLASQWVAAAVGAGPGRAGRSTCAPRPGARRPRWPPPGPGWSRPTSDRRVAPGWSRGNAARGRASPTGSRVVAADGTRPPFARRVRSTACWSTPRARASARCAAGPTALADRGRRRSSAWPPCSGAARGRGRPGPPRRHARLLGVHAHRRRDDRRRRVARRRAARPRCRSSPPGEPWEPWGRGASCCPRPRAPTACACSATVRATRGSVLIACRSRSGSGRAADAGDGGAASTCRPGGGGIRRAQAPAGHRDHRGHTFAPPGRPWRAAHGRGDQVVLHAPPRVRGLRSPRPGAVPPAPGVSPRPSSGVRTGARDDGRGGRAPASGRPRCSPCPTASWPAPARTVRRGAGRPPGRRRLRGGRAAVSADGVEAVADALRELADGFAGLVVTTGGTGFGPRDLTPEGTRRCSTGRRRAWPRPCGW